MLIEFRTENYRSLRDEQALTLQAGRVGKSDDPRPRRVQGYAEPLLTVAALYGANASGKSNVLGALGFMREAVLTSHRAWRPEGGVPRQPFAWGGKPSEPSLFEITLLTGGIRYQYGFVANDERFLEEWLYAWPQGRKQTWFVRDGDAYKFGEHLGGENKLIEQVTRPNALFLSAAVQHRHERLVPVYWWFQTLAAINVSGSKAEGAFWEIASELRNIGRWLHDGQRIDEFLKLLQGADVGIIGLKLGKPSYGTDTNTGKFISVFPPKVLLQHGTDSDGAWLPLEEESQGTRTLCHNGPLLLDTLRDGGVLLIDELEASLHPLLALEIVRQFNDPARNPRNAQLIFTTHDTHLLGTAAGDPPLRRDQIWLTEKDREGATCLYPLTDYKPREGENLERGYLQGRYGAIPFLGELARVAGN